MDSEFLNLYIETLMSTLEEYVKKDVMNRSHMEFSKRRIEVLEKQLEEFKLIDFTNINKK